MRCVFLYPGKERPNDLPASIVVLEREKRFENANSAAFNDSAFMGTACYATSQQSQVLITDSTTMLTRKGGLSLHYHFPRRVPGLDYNLFLVNEEDLEPSVRKKWDAMIKCGHGTVIDKYQIASLSTQVPDPFVGPLSLTCGLLATYEYLGVQYKGHVTRGFGVSRELEYAIAFDNLDFIEGKFVGQVYALLVNGAPGGSIVYVRDLDYEGYEYSHITNNTSIKAALSGPCLEMFQSGKAEFLLKDIDATTKLDSVIVLEKVAEVQVTIVSWYAYALEKQ